MTKSIKRLFIANRGEICRRIAVSAQRLGIQTIAVCDRPFPPDYMVGVIDHLVQVPEESTALYLNQDEMIRLAKEANADAIHPGFGFLSENADFAERVVKEGLIWVGPHAASITTMASKAKARDTAESSGVPLVPGMQDFKVPQSDQDDNSAIEAFAEKAGYPVLIKAAMGGGGKGMRQVHKQAELREALTRAQSEALSSFGDGALICEKYLGTPRHVEVQILADKHGRVVALGDRDCSVQRRHQKILEEAPAPQLGAETRKAMHAAATRLAAEVGYDSTGTVEFLVDWSADQQKSAEQAFFFLEMNTRLQVEHPVTEEVFGLDLVEWQLRVAAGDAIPESFETVKPRGHSIEARLYAEDVHNNFFPSPGSVAAFHPFYGPGIRWETGLDATDEITGRFDPMIAKLIATGETRTVALQRMVQALKGTVYAGPASNLPLVQWLCDDTEFSRQPVSTAWLPGNLDEILTGLQAQSEDIEALAQELLSQLKYGQVGGDVSLEASANIRSITQRAFSHDRSGAAQGAASSSGAVSATRSPHGDSRFGRLRAEAAGNPMTFWYATLTSPNGGQYWLGRDGYVWYSEVQARTSQGSTESAANSAEVTAPVPGKVINVNHQPGDEVVENTAIFVLESMKMEFEVKAPRSGVLAEIKVAIGDQVTAGQLLAKWSEEGE